MNEAGETSKLERVHALLYWLPVLAVGSWSFYFKGATSLLFLVVCVSLGVARLIDLLLARRRIEVASRLGYFDALTGLPNRRSLTMKLESALSRPHSLQAVLLMDMDRFKVINDTLGHPAGDEFLQEIAARLRAISNTSVFVARFGGDEFTMVLENLKDDRDARRMAARLLEVLGEPVLIKGNEITPSASIGIAMAGKTKPTPDEILSQADVALYRAKSWGRARYEVFRPELPMPSKRLLTIGSELKTAIEANELRLLYQPVVELRSMRVVGFEALIRWEHPTMGSLQPADFIPLAEEAGLMPLLGTWILREACRQARDWKDVFGQTVFVSVNLSSLQFRNLAFLPDLSTVLDTTGVDSTSLALEIKESALMEDEDAAQQTLGELRRLGISVAIDNFGVGYSSLSHLRRFHVQMLKIDHWFVRDLNDPRTRAIVQAIIALGHSLGMTVVAEGIEAEAEMALLASAGCDLAQGFLFEKPLEIAQVNKVLARGFSLENQNLLVAV